MINDFVTDSELMHYIRMNDEWAYKELLNRVEAIMVRHLCSNDYKFKAKYEYEELIQMGFDKLPYLIDTYRESSKAKFTTFFSICFRNLCMNCYRSNKCDKHKANSEACSTDNRVYGEDDTRYIDILIDKSGRYDVEKKVINKLVIEQIQNIIIQMDKDEKDIYDLWVVGYSYSSIANELGLSTKKVDNTLQKLKKLCRDKIDY